MKLLFTIFALLIKMSSAQEEITHDVFVNTTWTHLQENTQDLQSTLTQLDQLQLDVNKLIAESIQAKQSKKHYNFVLTL